MVGLSGSGCGDRHRHCTDVDDDSMVVERATSATISDSTVTHLADSFLGLPDAHEIGKHLTPKPNN